MATYTDSIIAAIKSSQPDASDLEIKADMHFYEIPGLDSMSIVDFQMELSSLIGDKAETVQPIMDMTLSEYAEILMSL